MIWTDVTDEPEAVRRELEAWRCPNPACGERAARLGRPQIRIQSPLVRGGELPAIDCSRGHRTALALVEAA